VKIKKMGEFIMIKKLNIFYCACSLITCSLMIGTCQSQNSFPNYPPSEIPYDDEDSRPLPPSATLLEEKVKFEGPFSVGPDNVFSFHKDWPLSKESNVTVYLTFEAFGRDFAIGFLGDDGKPVYNIIVDGWGNENKHDTKLFKIENGQAVEKVLVHDLGVNNDNAFAKYWIKFNRFQHTISFGKAGQQAWIKFIDPSMDPSKISHFSFSACKPNKQIKNIEATTLVPKNK
jgi:hypothetical protein